MKILSLSQLRSAENRAFSEEHKTHGELMEKAGTDAVKELSSIYTFISKKVCVVCGCGNNGGDGLVVARQLHNMGARVCIFAPLGEPKSETAILFLDGVSNVERVSELPRDCDFIIDALFGIGLDRPIGDLAQTVIEKMNAASCVKIALDVPSGVYCDGGMSKTVFKADCTVTFIAYKLCFLLPPSSSVCGRIILCDLGLAPREYTYLTVDKPTFLKRDVNSHKGTFGTALLVCGSYGMCGAEILAAKAAIKSGVGILKAIVCDKNYSPFICSVPEAVTLPVPTGDSGAPVVYDKTLFSGLSSSSAVLIGCGLGRSDEAQKLVFRTIQNADVPIVLDADGINAAAKDINIIKRAKKTLIITPHPAEMARLLDTTAADIENNRIRYAKTFSAEYECITVLKGARTIIASPDGQVYFNITGNAGMATGGSGDVLSGIIVALLAQGMSPLDAALSAVWVHGTAGDFAAKRYGEISVSAGDIVNELPNVYKIKRVYSFEKDFGNICGFDFSDVSDGL